MPIIVTGKGRPDTRHLSLVLCNDVRAFDSVVLLFRNDLAPDKAWLQISFVEDRKSSRGITFMKKEGINAGS